NGVDMKEPLVDKEGFPRADVDVYSVRHARAALHRLINDHKAIMAELETTMQQIFSSISQSSVSKHQVALVPFAVVNSVAPDSPASLAGLQPGDKVLKFGTIDANEGMGKLPPFVSSMAGKPVLVVVWRGTGEVRLTMTPKEWSGRGLLG
ncbi:hypothetical protein HDU76_005777, partial [Blyttiomyces sp. JEL0837]